MPAANWRSKVQQAVCIAQQVHNDNIAIVGTGLPLIGASLAKSIYAPDCTLIVESGLMDGAPPEVPTSVSDIRLMAHCAVQWINSRYVGFQTNEWLHHGNRMIAFIGGAQIDPYGNVNSTFIGDDYLHPKTRFSGSGGANGICTFVNTIIMIQHEKRRFMKKIDYITSPGWIGPEGRASVGLPADRGPLAVITDRGVFKFDSKTHRMYLEGYFESSSPKEIEENTGFEIDVSKAKPIAPPEKKIIKMIHEKIDPGMVFIKIPPEDLATAY
jgi:glutaconate CoA-transferase subunit B